MTTLLEVLSREKPFNYGNNVGLNRAKILGAVSIIQAIGDQFGEELAVTILGMDIEIFLAHINNDNLSDDITVKGE